MRRTSLAAICACLGLWAIASPARADGLAEIRSLAPLDEPRGYCVDMIGSQARASADRPLQAHTCYAYQGRVAVDQGVSTDGAARGLLRFPHFGVCLDGDAARAGSPVALKPCDGEAPAQTARDDAGRIMPRGDAALCLTIAGGASRAGGGGSPPHLIRGLTWERCEAQAGARQFWRVAP
ncbi:MAG: hypothetical protein ACK4NA_00745 [Alphaproteobacteria bacterium]